MGTKLTLIQTSFTLVVTKITTIITTIQVSYKELTGAEATSIQISSGSSTVTDAKEASSALIHSLKAITVNKGAVEKVELALKEAAAGTLNDGEEIEGAAFLLLLEEFFSIIELDLESSAITALSFKIINSKVTLTTEQLTQITVFQTSIKVIIIKITVAIEFFQSQVQTITGSTATSDQILAGDSSESITIATEEIVKILKVMTVNIKSIKKIKEMMKEISKDGISATASGIEEVTNSKYLILVVKFFNMIAGNFIVSDLDMIIDEILVAKLTIDLTEIEKSDFEFIIEKMEGLIVEIMTSIDVLQFQLIVMTGTTANLLPPEQPVGMMTTRGPGSMMSGSPSGILTTRGPGGMTTGVARLKSKMVRNLLKSSLRKYLE